MNSSTTTFQDIFKDRRKEYSNYIWMNRKINPKVACVQSTSPIDPSTHKEAVLKSPKIQELLDTLSRNDNLQKQLLEELARNILNEIGYNKNLRVVRWLGLAIIKVVLRVSSGVFVNEQKFLQLKDSMGDCPVVFVPSHRSYADFVMLTYLCFNYDVALPAVAAGMDFQSMLAMGEMLRNAGAFYMRRTYNSDVLYWTIFKQYVYQLIANGDLPVEFFIEGTRSRSNKSLSPKYGLMSMVLKPLFFGEVPDILFVPINISYDRILEESLYAFELLGVPKPKESTSGLFKSLSVLKEKYGSMHVHFDSPISAKQFFGNKLDRSVHNLGPLHKQELTEQEKSLMPPLAHIIVHKQQKLAALTTFNLVALILNNNIIKRAPPLSLYDLKTNISWLTSIMESFGAYVHKTELDKDIAESFEAHHNLVAMTDDDKVILVTNKIVLDNRNPAQLKAHSLSEKTMTHSVPFVMLQIYMNPSLFFLVDAALIVIILKVKTGSSEDILLENYRFLRSLFSLEFVTYKDWEKQEFDKALIKLVDHKVVYKNNNGYFFGSNERLAEILINSFQPFLLSYLVTCCVLQTLPKESDEKSILKNVQMVMEMAINEAEQNIHPYCLNLDTLTNCLNSLSSMGILNKSRKDNKFSYKISKGQISIIRTKLDTYIPDVHKIKCSNSIFGNMESKL